MTFQNFLLLHSAAQHSGISIWLQQLKPDIAAIMLHSDIVYLCPSIFNTVWRSVANYGGLLFVAEIDIEKCVQDSIKIFCSTPKSATFRQHAWTQKHTTHRKAVHSYYTQDYHEAPKTELVSSSVAVTRGYWHLRAAMKAVASRSQKSFGELRKDKHPVRDLRWLASVLPVCFSALTPVCFSLTKTKIANNKKIR